MLAVLLVSITTLAGFRGTSLPPVAPIDPVPPSCSDSIAARLQAQLTPWLKARTEAKTFSGVVLVACNGKPIYSGSYGMADREKGVVNSLDTRFNLGSMNKMWTAIAVAQLVEQGKIELNAPVGRYLPELTNTQLRDQVLVKHLLTHTSGLGSYFKRGFLANHVAVTKMSDYLQYFVDDSLLFVPGARMQYSNAGFAVLGMLVERVSGMDFYDYMQRNVFDRAGMKHAIYADLRAPKPDYASGYGRAPGATEETSNLNGIEMRGGPAGGAYATAADVLAFSQALFSNKLVGAPLVREFTDGKVDMGPATKYGYGFGTTTLNGWRSVGHNGGAPGVGTEFLAFPEQGVDVIVLTNTDMPVATQVIQRAARIVTGQDMPPGAPDPAMNRRVPPPAAGTTTPSVTDRMPDTPAAKRLTNWLAAVNSGLQAYTAFVASEMPPRSDLTAAQRAEGTMKFMTPLGALRFKQVVTSSAEELVIIVEAASDGALFTVTATVEPGEPHRLMLVNVQPNRD